MDVRGAEIAAVAPAAEDVVESPLVFLLTVAATDDNP
jgi:hypothetical protein